MHIPDGFLTTRVALSLDVISAAGILFAAKRARIDSSDRVIPLMGVLGAFVFAAQMLNFPVAGGTSGHLIGGSLLAILLGPMAGFLTMATVVIAQALFLQDGGLVALGANVFNIGAITCFSGYAVFRLFKGKSGRDNRLAVAGFLAGWFSSVISSAFCALQLCLSGAVPLQIGLTAMPGYHMIVGIIEGALTAGVLGFLGKERPDLLETNGAGRFRAVDWAGALVFIGIPAAILVLAGSSSLPDPMEKLLIASKSHVAEESAMGGIDFLIRGTIFTLIIVTGFFLVFIWRRRSRP